MYLANRALTGYTAEKDMFTVEVESMEKTAPETKNKAQFTAAIQYSEKTVRKLAEVQYTTFNFTKKIGQMLLGVALILAGIFIGSHAAIVALFVGCIVIVSLDFLPRQTAKQICRQYNGSFPNVKYYFTHTGLRTQMVPEEAPYKTMVRLIDDGTYLYLFLKDHSAFMVEKATVKGGSVDALKTMVESRSGLQWKKPFSLIGLKIKDIRDAQALSGAGQIRDSGERLDGPRY